MSDTALTSSTAQVAKVQDEYTVVINRGREHGIKEGARFLLYGLGEEIIDPVTKESLGQLEIVRGIGIATHVQDKLATVESSKTRRPTPTIRTTKRSPKGGAAGILASLYGGEETTVEERQGEPTLVPFDGVKDGDYARPL